MLIRLTPHAPRGSVSPTQSAPERAETILPRVHRVFGSLKTWLRGTHHGVGDKHLQAYLDEFTFRFNRRRTPMAAFQMCWASAPSRRRPPTTSCTGWSKPDKHEGRFSFPSPAPVTGARPSASAPRL